jgi:hypothetical protein
MASEDLSGHAYHSRKLLRLDFSTVVRPLEKRLSLPTAAMQITRLAIVLDLTYVAPHRFPSFDLSCIFAT